MCYSSYAVEDKKKLFWKVFGSLLEESSTLAGLHIYIHAYIVYCQGLIALQYSLYLFTVLDDASLLTPPLESLHWHDSIPALSQYQYSLVCGMEQGRPDHANYRRLLWRCLYDIPAYAEPRSRILVPLILQFIELALPFF